MLARRTPDASSWPNRGTDFRAWTVRWLAGGPVTAGTLGLVSHRRSWWRGGRWRIVFTLSVDEDTGQPTRVAEVSRRLPSPRDVELVHGPTSSHQYLAYRRVGRWPRRRLERWHGDGRDYSGWTARAATGATVPPGIEGSVVACQRHGEDLVHVIDWRPYIELHVMLPWPGIELIEPTSATGV